MLPSVQEIQSVREVTPSPRRPTSHEDKKPATQPSATLQVSETGAGLLLAQSTARATGGLRADLVGKMRQQIQSGRYAPNGTQVADGMAAQMLLDKLV